MKTAKKLFAALLAAMMIMALMTVPALAAGETYTITITSPDASNGHQFKAYQIFSGTLSSEGTLTDVEWGTGIDEQQLNALYAALEKVEIDSKKPFENMTQNSAASVSDVLSGSGNNSALAIAFQELIATKDTTYTYLSSTSTEVSHGSNSDGVYTATGVSAGYYIVVDESTENAAELMLQVVGDVTATAKMDVPTATKYAGEVAVTDNATFSVGDEIPYTLTGTTPNFSNEGYSYKFTDNMDAALQLVYTPSQSNASQVEGGVKVTIGTGADAKEITSSFDITYSNNVLTLTANELKDVEGLSTDSMLYVTYTAKVTGAQTNVDVNNRVVVESQMDTADATKTPEIKEQVYPVTLEITKVDGNRDALAGAKFVLYRYVGEESTKQYATTTAQGGFTGWTEDAEQAATLESGEGGKITLVGVGAGTFYLEETEAPTGYNKLDAIIQIEISTTSEVDGTGTVKLKELKYSLTDVTISEGTATKVPGGANDGTQVNVTGDALNSGTVAFSVTNNQGATLPSTGGIGTTIFYVVGGVLIVGAVVLLVTRKRMKED